MSQDMKSIAAGVLRDIKKTDLPPLPGDDSEPFDRTMRHVIEYQAGEIERLLDCEQIKLVSFLSRKDIRVSMTHTYDVVIRHEDWKFRGRGPNVITAARMAIVMERKYEASQAVIAAKAAKGK